MTPTSERSGIRNPIRQTGIAVVNAVPFGAEFIGRSVTTPNLWKGLGIGLAHGAASALLLGIDVLCSSHGITQLTSHHALETIDAISLVVGGTWGAGGLVYGAFATEEVVQGVVLGIGDGIVKTTERYIPGAKNIKNDSAYGPFFLPKKERDERAVTGDSFTLRRSTNLVRKPAKFPSIIFTAEDETLMA